MAASDTFPAAAAIDAVLERAVDSGRIAAVAAGAATADGRVYDAAFGIADPETGAPLTSRSLFRVASMTKAVTSVAVMQLVERGQVSLDAPAASFLPELKDVQVLGGFDDAGQPRLRAPASAPTVHQLLTHTSGFVYEMWNAQIARLRDAGGVPGILTGGPGFLSAPLAFDPGSRWEYGIGTDWLGRLVERVAGERLDRYVARHVLGPLGIDDAAFDLSDEQTARLVAVQQRQGDGSLEPTEFPVGVVDDFASGGAGLVTTAAGYLRFMRALLHRGELDGVRIVGDPSVAEMTRRQIGPLAVEPLHTTDPALSCDVDFFPGSKTSWGLGFLLNEESLPGRRSSGSYGWAGICNSYYWIDPRRAVCGAIFMQLLPFYDPDAVALYADFERAVYSAIA